MRKLKAFAKFLPKTRAWVDVKLANGKEIRRNKVIDGLAVSGSIHRGAPHPPKFQPGYEFGGPKNVSFWKDSEQGGRYVKVFDYFQESTPCSCILAHFLATLTRGLSRIRCEAWRFPSYQHRELV